VREYFIFNVVILRASLLHASHFEMNRKQNISVMIYKLLVKLHLKLTANIFDQLHPEIVQRKVENSSLQLSKHAKS